MAAQRKLTKELAESIAAAVADGFVMEAAAESNGIHRSTLHAWLKRGRKEREDGQTTMYTRFVFRMERARAEFQIRHIDGLYQGFEQLAPEQAMCLHQWFPTHGPSRNDWRLSAKEDLVNAPEDTEIVIVMQQPDRLPKTIRRTTVREK